MKNEIFLAILGALAAIAVAATLFAIFTWATDTSGITGLQYDIALLVAGVFFSGAATVIVALPVFLLFRGFGLVSWQTVLISGIAIGILGAVTTDWHGIESMPRVLAFGAIGAISATVFWSIWHKKGVRG